jgi:hypothetical protein
MSYPLTLWQLYFIILHITNHQNTSRSVSHAWSVALKRGDSRGFSNPKAVATTTQYHFWFHSLCGYLRVWWLKLHIYRVKSPSSIAYDFFYVSLFSWSNTTSYTQSILYNHQWPTRHCLNDDLSQAPLKALGPMQQLPCTAKKVDQIEI